MDNLHDMDIVRAVSTVVRAVRDDGSDAPLMEVRFSPFGQWYEVDSMFEGRFLERTELGAFGKTFSENARNVKVLFNHGYDPQVGDKVLGPIRSLTEEPDSPVGVVELLDTSYNRDLMPGLEAGVYGSSFRFRVIKDEWNDEPGRSEHNPEGIPERTIKEVRLFEFGPVTFPANPAATAGIRSATDEFYERLARSEPARVAELIDRAKKLRTPLAPAAEGTGVEQGAATDTDEPTGGHSHGFRVRQMRMSEYPNPHGEGGRPMPDLETMRGRLTELEGERRAIHDEAGEADLNDEQSARWEALDAEETELRSSITDAEDAERRAARVAESRARWGSVQLGLSPTPSGADPGEVRYLRPTEARDRALRLLEDRESIGHLEDDQLEKVERALRLRTASSDGAAVARRLLVTETDSYRSAFMKGVSQVAPAFTPEETRALDEFRAMSIGTDTSGGFGVPVLIDPTIILTGQGSLNPFRQIAQVVSITNDEWKGVSSAGVSWSIDSEAAAVSDDTPTLAQPTVTTGMARGFVPYSIEVGMDYPSFASEIGRLLAEGYDELQASHMAVGTVSTTNRGIVTALDANTNVEVVVTTDGAFGGVDINKVWTALPDRYKANATWVMSHDVGAEVATFGNSNNLSFVTVDFTGIVETLRARPVRYSSYTGDFTATTGTSNLIVVGDFRNFVIADRVGMSVELVPHLFDTTANRPTGQRGLFAFARFGSNSVNDLGFRLLQNQ